MATPAQLGMSRRGFVWLSLFTVLGLAILAALGTWQVQRMHWKEGLIARIEARATAEPMTLAAALRQWRQTGDIEYARIRLAGRFDHAHERHRFTVVSGRMGWNVVTPLHTEAGPTVLVDRGFVPDELKAPQTRAQGQIEGRVEVTGLVRAPEIQGWFVPDNEPANNVWHWRDLDAMSAGLPGADGGVAPFYIEAEDAPVPGGYPQGGVTRLDLPNPHFGYALTWYGLAGTLLGVYLFFVAGQFRRRPFTE